MKYVLHGTDELLAVHNGETITWSIKGFNRTSIAKGQEEFDHVNEYIEWEGTKWQDEFFSILKEIDAVFNEFGQFDAKQRRLVDLMSRLFSTIHPERTVGWVESHSRIQMATNLKDSYTEADKDHDKTFLRDEYVDVIALAMWMKLIVGVLGNYLENFKNKLGTVFKEHGALRLLDKTWVMKSPQIERLMRYIDAWIRQTNKSDAAVMGGLSSFELPMFVLAHIMVRKLATGNLEDNLNNGGVIVNIFRGVKSALNDLKRHFPTMYDKSKYMTDAVNGEERNNYSVAELYTISQTIRAGDVAIYKHFIRHIEENIHHVDDTLSLEEVQMCLEVVPILMDYPIEDHTVILTQWVTQQLIPSRMIFNLNKDELLRLTALCQALLWHWGFKDLAVLITAEVDKGQLVAGAGFNRSNKRVKTDPMAMLGEIYPHIRPSNTHARDYNLAHNAITIVKEKLVNCWLRLTPPSYMREHAETLYIDERGAIIPDDLPTQLAEMLIHVGK